MFAIVLCVSGGACGKHAVDADPANDWTAPDLRVIAPDSVVLDPGFETMIKAMIAARGPAPGLSQVGHTLSDLTVSLTEGLESTLDGTADSPLRIIILPINRVPLWSRAKLAQVVEHELAHIELATALDFRVLPLWFDEGFAEWATHRDECAAEARIVLSMVTAERLGRAPPLQELDIVTRSGLTYDFLANFFTFVDTTWPGSLTSGALVAAVRDLGVAEGFLEAVGVEVTEAHRQWYDGLRRDLTERAAGLSCK